MSDIVGGGAAASAPKGKRIAAGIIDLIIVPVILGVLIGLLLLNATEVVRSVVLVLVNIGWLIVRDSVYSPGRAMVGLKIQTVSGGKVTVVQAFLRNILLIIPFVLVIGYIVELIFLFSKGHRLADGWAKTQVVQVS